MITISMNKTWYPASKKSINTYKGIAPAVPRVPGIPGKRPVPNQMDNSKATLSRKLAFLIAFIISKLSDWLRDIK
jgi:hypothetical protein